MADFVGAHHEDVVFVPNPTTGINAILNSLKFDDILIYNHTYNAVKHIAHCFAKKYDAKVHMANLPIPVTSEDEVVEVFLDQAKGMKGTGIKVAIIDHISSASAILFPVERLTRCLQDMGILVLIDGAHAPGQVPGLNLTALNADFYTGTLHKWCYATKGVALLWVHKRHQHAVRPLVTSHNYGLGYQEEFFKQVIHISQSKST